MNFNEFSKFYFTGLVMSEKRHLICSRCGDPLGDEKVFAIRGITGLPVEVLASYNLKLCCRQCDRLRERPSKPLVYVLAFVALLSVSILLQILIAAWIGA